MKNLVIAVHPLLGCLQAAEELVGGIKSPWQGANPTAQSFLKNNLPLVGECRLIHEMESRAARNADKINKWLQEKKFSIQLPPEGDLFLASIIDVMSKWLHGGERTSVKDYDAVKLDRETARAIYEENWPTSKYVVQVKTQTGDHAYMYLPDRAPKNESDVIQMIDELISSIDSESARMGVSAKYEGVIFPEISLDTQPDVSWLQNTSTIGNDALPLIISCCMQQVKLRLDLEGASIKAAAAMMMTRGLGPTPYLIDRPFLLWFMREGVTKPLIYAYLAEDSWVSKK